MTKVRNRSGAVLTPALKLGLNDRHHVPGFSHELVLSVASLTMRSV